MSVEPNPAEPLGPPGASADAGQTVSPAQVLHMPAWRVILRQAAWTAFVGSILPMVVFYVAFGGLGLKGAVAVTLGWYYAGVALSVARRRPILGATALGAVLLTMRAVVTFWTGSAFLYFVQPIAGTVVTATVIAGTAVLGRPLLDRIAHDFCPFPETISTQLRAAQFFRYLSVVWALTYLLNAASTFWLLTNASLGGFLVLKSILSPVLTGAAIAGSYVLFRLVLRRSGVHIRWGASGGDLAAP